MQKANAQDWSNLLWAVATMGYQAIQVASLIKARCEAILGGKFRAVTPQSHATVLWALATTGANKDTVKRALDVLVSALIDVAHNGKCKDPDINQVAFALHYYGMAEAEQAFLAGLTPGQQALYKNTKASYK